MDIFNASGIKSKHITDIISPEANAKIKLSILFETLLKKHPIIPPNCSSKSTKK